MKQRESDSGVFRVKTLCYLSPTSLAKATGRNIFSCRSSVGVHRKSACRVNAFQAFRQKPRCSRRGLSSLPDQKRRRTKNQVYGVHCPDNKSFNLKPLSGGLSATNCRRVVETAVWPVECTGCHEDTGNGKSKTFAHPPFGKHFLLNAVWRALFA